METLKQSVLHFVVEIEFKMNLKGIPHRYMIQQNVYDTLKNLEEKQIVFLPYDFYDDSWVDNGDEHIFSCQMDFLWIEPLDEVSEILVNIHNIIYDIVNDVSNHLDSATIYIDNNNGKRYSVEIERYGRK